MMGVLPSSRHISVWRRDITCLVRHTLMATRPIPTDTVNTSIILVDPARGYCYRDSTKPCELNVLR
ncbi:MAG: hypothetical protein METHAR1v1_90007, partial [Methanothrix sp.]